MFVCDQICEVGRRHVDTPFFPPDARFLIPFLRFPCVDYTTFCPVFQVAVGIEAFSAGPM
jgi:hypothetical protein